MGYSLIRYLKNLPLAYYLKGGFTQMRGPTISLFLSPQQSAALVCRGHRAQGFELEIANLPDAPPVNGVDSGFAVASRSFSQKLLARSRARGVPRFIFIPDLATSDLYCNVHSVANLRELSIETLLESLNEGYIDDVAFVCHEIPLLASELRSDEFETYVWSSHPVGEDIAVTLTGTELTGEVLKQINGQAVVVRKSDGTKLELNSPVPHLLLWLENSIV